MGVKPLYYCDTGEACFSAQKSNPCWSILMFSARSILKPRSIPDLPLFPGQGDPLPRIQKLAPGHYLVVKNGRVSCKEYWDLRFDRPRSWGNIRRGRGCNWELLKATVRGHMIGDVPVGILLSGGVDSAALSVVRSAKRTGASARLQSASPGRNSLTNAHTRGWPRSALEPTTTRSPSPLSSLPTFCRSTVWHMEEPVCEPPAVALYYVSKLAREHVKVVLSGEGGDEAFGGYQNYRNMLFLEKGKKAAGVVAPLLAAALGAAGHLKGAHRARKYAPLMTTALPDYYYSRVSSPFGYFNRNKQSLYTSEFRDTLRSNRSGGAD